MRRYLIATAIAVSAAAAVLSAPVAEASEALAPVAARQLDTQPLEFSASAAHRERMMIIQQNNARQRYYQNRGYGRGHGYGRGPGYGRGYGGGTRYPGESPWGRAVRRGW